MSSVPDAGSVAGLTPAEIVKLNDDLDRRLLDELARADLARVPDAPDRWVPVEVAAHLAEFPHFFATELDRFRDDPTATIGRTHEDEHRLAAVAAAAATDQASLLEACRRAFAELASRLGTLAPEELGATTQNVRYGPEPMTRFLDRYVVGHKQGHLRQLEELRLAEARPLSAPSTPRKGDN